MLLARGSCAGWKIHVFPGAKWQPHFLGEGRTELYQCTGSSSVLDEIVHCNKYCRTAECETVRLLVEVRYSLTACNVAALEYATRGNIRQCNTNTYCRLMCVIAKEVLFYNPNTVPRLLY